MKALKQGAFVRWSSTDDEGKFSHVGQVAAVNKTQVTLDTAVGVWTIDLDDGEFTPARKPRTWNLRTEAPLKTVSRAVPAPKRELSARTLEVVKVVRANPGLSRKEYVELVATECSMSVAGASTYYNTARKHV